MTIAFRDLDVMRIFAFCAALALPFAASASAKAQPQEIRSAAADSPLVEGSGASYSVVFVDDALNAMNDGEIIPRLRVRPQVGRVTLIRPRTQFVTEMLKSVEQM